MKSSIGVNVSAAGMAASPSRSNPFLAAAGLAVLALAPAPAPALPVAGYPTGVPGGDDVPVPLTNYPATGDVVIYAKHNGGTTGGSSEATAVSLATAVSMAEAASPAATKTIVLCPSVATDTVGYFRLTSPFDFTKPNITIQPRANTVIWLEGVQVVPTTSWVPDGGKWRNGDTNLIHGTREVWTEDLLPTRVVPMPAAMEAVFYNDQPLWQVGSTNLVGPGTFYADPVAKRIWIGNSPTNSTVKVTRVPYAFRFHSNNNYNTSNARVRGLGFRYFRDMGVAMKGNNQTLEKNTFAWNGDAGAVIYDDVYNPAKTNTVSFDGYRYSYDGRPKIFGYDNAAIGNIFVANGRNGFRATRQDNLTFSGNYVAYNNVERYATAWSAAGVKCTGMYRTTTGSGGKFENNIFEFNYAAGLWLDISCKGLVVANNTMRLNSFRGTDSDAGLDGSVNINGTNVALNGGAFGLHVELSREVEVAYNVLDGNASAGLQISESSLNLVANNTVVNNKSLGIIVKDGNRQTTGINGVSIPGLLDECETDGITWDTFDNIFENNILQNDNQQYLLGNGSLARDGVDTITDARVHDAGANPAFFETAPSTAVMVGALDSNLYWMVDQHNLFLWDKWASESKEFAPYATISTLITDYPEYSSNKGKFFSGTTDPLFVNFAAGDYRLRSGLTGIPAPMPPALHHGALPVLSGGDGTVTFSAGNFTAYGTGEDGGGSFAIENESKTLHLTGNAWKKTPFSYAVTPKTMLRFRFKAADYGEFVGIGLDNDNGQANDKRVFQLGPLPGPSTPPMANGWQFYNRGYTLGVPWIWIEIPIGLFYTGQMNHLVFVNNGVNSNTPVAYYRDVTVYERP